MMLQEGDREEEWEQGTYGMSAFRSRKEEEGKKKEYGELERVQAKEEDTLQVARRLFV